MFKTGCCSGNTAVEMEKHDNEDQEKDEKPVIEKVKEPMISYKLTYFNARIGGEMIRLIFHYAGVSFEDLRITESDWPTLKTGAKWGKLPILEFDGHKIYSSTAISRLLAKRYDLMGQNEIEAAKCDEIVEVCQELRNVWGKFYFEKDETIKSSAKVNLELTLSDYFENFNATVEENGKIWLVGDKITWADLFFANFVDVCQATVDENILNNYPALKKLKEAVFSEPKIKEYVDKRPENSH